MASGSGKNQEDNQANEPVPPAPPPESLREEPTAAAAAEADPPPTADSERPQERAHGSPEAGGHNPSAPSAAAVVAAEAAAAARGNGAGIVASSRRGSAVGKPPLPPRVASVSRAGERKPVRGKPPIPLRAVPGSRSKSEGKKPMSHAEVVESGMAVRAKWREIRQGRMNMEEEFNELLLESKKAVMEGTATRQEEQVNSVTIWPKKYYKGSLWRKFLDRVGISDLNSRIMNAAMNYEKMPMAGIIRHYGLLELVAGRGVEFDANALNLQRVYPEFRPVLGDGECFYRSFIFHYLEQVLDRQDKHEERRLLVAAKEVARQHARLGWADDFSRSYKVFKKLIEKVMRWKTRSRRKHVPTANSYRIEKLLQYFNSDGERNDIYAFLRFVAAIWICSHSEEFEPLIPELKECGHTLRDWCFGEVVQQRVMTDHVQIVALARAFGVPLRVENLLEAFGDDLHIVQGPQDNMPRSTCWPHRHQQVPPDHEVPRVTLLYTYQHYDIIYPDPDAAVSQDSDTVERLPAMSPSQDRGSICSGEKSGEEQIARAEGTSGENQNQQTERGGVESDYCP